MHLECAVIEVRIYGDSSGKLKARKHKYRTVAGRDHVDDIITFFTAATVEFDISVIFRVVYHGSLIVDIRTLMWNTVEIDFSFRSAAIS